jgi:hypothetical protein
VSFLEFLDIPQSAMLLYLMYHILVRQNDRMNKIEQEISYIKGVLKK